MPKDPSYYKQRMLRLDDYARGWDEVWKDCADYILPWRVRFLHRNGRISSNAGTTSGGSQFGDRAIELRSSDKRINSRATMGVRLGAAGMMQGFTSPARPWFRLTVADPDLADRKNVKEWFWEVEARIRAQMARTNIYQALPLVYESMLCFGPAALHLDEDPDTVLRAYNWPIGSYRLACDEHLRVDTIYRRVRLTVRQSVQKFGLDAQSTGVKEHYEKGRYEEPVDIIHAIEPNPGYKGSGLTDKPYVSVWIDERCDDEDPPLHVGGYDEFPVMTPRWGLLDEDVYGYSPAMDALGDIKALQLYERRKAQAAEWINRPLLSVPASMKIAKKDLVPGKLLYRSGANHGDRIEPAYTVPPQAITAMADQIAAHESRIDRLMHSDLWLLNIEAQKEMTATEVIERRTEKMQQLGALVERVNDELAEPLVSRFFYVMNRRGMLPEPPKELEGLDMRVEFISEMAMAQKMVNINSIQQAAMFEQMLAPVHPDIADNFDADKAFREFAESSGLQPDLIRDSEEVEQMRQERAQQQQAMQDAAELQMQADAANKLGNTPMGEDSALDSALGVLGGAAAGGATGGVV